MWEGPLCPDGCCWGVGAQRPLPHWPLVRRTRYWLDEPFLFAPAAPAPHRFRPGNDERDPDEGERDQVRQRKGLVIQEHAKEETAARRQVLEKAERGQAEFSRGVAKPDQRQTGHR